MSDNLGGKSLQSRGLAYNVNWDYWAATGLHIRSNPSGLMVRSSTKMCGVGS